MTTKIEILKDIREKDIEERYSEIIEKKYPKQFEVTLRFRTPEDITTDDVIHFMKVVVKAGVIVNVTEVIG